jgi:protein-tyrosine phosphatase
MRLSDWPGYVPGLPDTLNLRDLGGLPCAGGRSVRHGFFFRSGPLADLAPEQLSRIDELGLCLILDLRSPGEVEGAQDYVPQGSLYQRVGGMRFDDGDEVDFSPAGMQRLAAEAQTGEFDDLMRHLYASMLFGNPAIHDLVDALRTGTVPLLFHCSAGKDRTGVCAMVIGLILGVPKASIIADYLITNEYRRSIIENPPASFDDMPPGITAETWAEVNGVKAEALESTMAAIDERHSSVEDYLQAEFGLGNTELAELRERYTA